MILLCGDGPLVERVRRGRTGSTISSSAEPTPRGQDRGDRASFTSDGARIALCNTSVVGEAVELLKTGGLLGRVDDPRAARTDPGSTAWRLDRAIARHRRPGRVSRRGGARSASSSSPAWPPRQGGGPAAGPARGQPLRRPARRCADASCARSSGSADDDRIVLAVGYADHRKGHRSLRRCRHQRCSARCRDMSSSCGSATTEPARLRAAATRGLESGRRRGPLPVSRTGRGFRSVFRRRRCLPDDVARRSVSASWCCTRSTPELPVIGFEGAGGFVELLEPRLRRAGAVSATPRPWPQPRAAPAGSTRRGATADRGRKGDRRPGVLFLDYARDLVELGAAARAEGLGGRAQLQLRAASAGTARSILAQTYRPHEIIFLDDCSSRRQRRGRRETSCTTSADSVSHHPERDQPGLLPSVAARPARSDRRSGLDRRSRRRLRAESARDAGAGVRAAGRSCWPTASRSRSTKKAGSSRPTTWPGPPTSATTKWRRRLRPAAASTRSATRWSSRTPFRTSAPC